jgi:hypothetical protein
MILNFLFILLQNLVFDFPFFDVSQILSDEVLGIGRILLDAPPFPCESFMISTELNQNFFETAFLPSAVDQISEPGIGEKIKSPESQTNSEKNTPTMDWSLLKRRSPI